MRLVVIGVSGSGKTTLARQIAQTLDLPQVELDTLYWEANWQAASRPVFHGRVQEATAGDAWVVDGNYRQSQDIVWSRATHLAWLDYGLATVMGRVLWRTVCRLFSQQELWNGNRESIRGIFGRDSIVMVWVCQPSPPPKEVSGASGRRRVQTPDCVPVQQTAGSLKLAAVPTLSQYSGAPMTTPIQLPSVESVAEALRTKAYIADHSLATAIFLALKLNRPLFLEGEAGVGKTEVAKILSQMLDTRLIRLQCYEGLDVSTAVYEWNYARQMLQIRLMEATRPDSQSPADSDALTDKGLQESAIQDLFSDTFLLRRPLLQAIDSRGQNNGKAPILLIDELDRADEEFEAFLLEVLSDFQITIPEIGTIRAATPPVVVITSNRTREIHDALKRRCLYHWIDYPSFEKEYTILRAKAPDASERLSREVVGFVQELRRGELYKFPGVAETLDWMNALTALDQEELTENVVDETLGVLLKYRDDIEKVQGQTVREIVQVLRKSAAVNQ